jgi:hypothetical protein
MPARLAAARAGIVLSPAGRTECLGVRLDRTMAFTGPPGRGYLVLDGECGQGQVPLPNA